MSRKPRSDATLKTLPEERQRAIVELLKTKSLEAVRGELRQSGIETSAAALSEFNSWWNLNKVATPEVVTGARRKVRSDARLKTLPDDRQRSLVELLRKGSLESVRSELRKDGLDTSLAALSEFYAWWHLQEQFQQDATTTEALLDQLKHEIHGITEEQLDELGQRTFSLLAIRRQDPDVFVKVRTARFKGQIEREKLELRRQAEQRQVDRLRFDRDKWIEESCRKILQAATDARAKEIAESGATNEEKIRLLRETYFADIDELEKSGQVTLPE